MALSEKENKCIETAYDYICTVANKQGRFDDFEVMWGGYNSVLRGQLTRDGFRVVYDTVFMCLDPIFRLFLQK
ncbi:MAG: hypothetical protein AB7P94_17230 [Steroidobacteraceae bacterium]